MTCGCVAPVYETCGQCKGVAPCTTTKGLQEVEQVQGDCLGEVLAGEHAAGLLRRQLAWQAPIAVCQHLVAKVHLVLDVTAEAILLLTSRHSTAGSAHSNWV